MTRRISAETFAHRAALVRASLWATEGEAVVAFRRRRALARQMPEPDKQARKREASREFHQTGALA